MTTCPPWSKIRSVRVWQSPYQPSMSHCPPHTIGWSRSLRSLKHDKFTPPAPMIRRSNAAEKITVIPGDFQTRRCWIHSAPATTIIYKLLLLCQWNLHHKMIYIQFYSPSLHICKTRVFVERHGRIIEKWIFTVSIRAIYTLTNKTSDTSGETLKIQVNLAGLIFFSLLTK